MGNVPPEHRTGGGTYTCQYCGETLNVACIGHPWGDRAYCDECEVEYKRSRTSIAEPERDGGFVIERREHQPEYAEYLCHECEEPHENTIVDGEWIHRTVEIVGYDENDILCPCGERHNGYIEAGDPVECECGRSFELVVTGDPRSC